MCLFSRKLFRGSVILENISLAFGIAGVICSAIFAYLTFVRTGKKDLQEETQVMISLKADMKYISQQIQEVKESVDTIDRKMANTGERISRIEQKCESQDETIRRLNDRLNIIEKGLIK